VTGSFYLTQDNFFISIRLFVVQVVPLLMWSYVIQLVFMVFLPIMGRNGTAANPDITIGKSCQPRYNYW
jgi:hypothetical protein